MYKSPRLAVPLRAERLRRVFFFCPRVLSLLFPPKDFPDRVRPMPSLTPTENFFFGIDFLRNLPPLFFLKEPQSLFSQLLSPTESPHVHSPTISPPSFFEPFWAESSSDDFPRVPTGNFCLHVLSQISFFTADFFVDSFPRFPLVRVHAPFFSAPLFPPPMFLAHDYFSKGRCPKHVP